MRRPAEVSAPTTCRSCDAPIFWATSQRGKRMPFDISKATPPKVECKEVGGVANFGAAGLRGLFVILAGEARAATLEDVRLHRDLLTCHFATCAQADQWRKPR
jgi:hypothetical protein